MPSYRIRFAVGPLRPGIAPDAVLPAAAGAARERTTVEAYDVAVVRGAARLTVRFLADDDGEAIVVARGVLAAVVPLADAAAPELTRRNGPRWHPVPCSG